MYEMQHFVHNFPPAPRRVYRETSWFSAIYAGKIAFFTFGRFVGSNFEKPRTSQESVLCTKCSISYIISHRPVRGVYRETSSFSVIYAGKIAFFTFGNFVGSRVKSPFYVRNAAFRTQFPADPWTGSTERLLGFQPFMQEKMKFWADLEIRGF